MKFVSLKGFSGQFPEELKKFNGKIQKPSIPIVNFRSRGQLDRGRSQVAVVFFHRRENNRVLLFVLKKNQIGNFKKSCIPVL